MSAISGVYGHFSRYTNVPVEVLDVRKYILDLAIVDEIRIFETKLDPTKVSGFLHVFSKGGKKVARVVCSDQLLPRMQRLVCCKELLHILDEDDDMATTRVGVQRLIENLGLSNLADLPASVRSDRNGSLHALMILFPRDYLHQIRPLYRAGKVTEEEIATRVRLPPPYVRVALSDAWQQFLETYIV